MKKVSILLMILVAIPLYSQTVKEQDERVENRNKEYRTLLDQSAGNGGYGALTLGYTMIDGRNGLLMGGRGEWIIGHGLGLGFGGYGFINDPTYNVDDNLYYSLTGGYGGFVIEPIIMGRWPVHIALPVLLGAGGVALTSYSDEVFMQLEPYDVFLEDASAFLVAEPGIELELNMVRWMRLAFFGSYRFTTNIVSMGSINDKAINGWSAGITFKVGSF